MPRFVGISRRACLIVPALTASLVGGAPAVADSAGSADPVTVQVQANGFRFCASTAVACTPLDTGAVTVPAGSTVVWTYNDHECDIVAPCPGHNVVVTGGKAGPVLKRDGAVLLSETFNQPGTFSYLCAVHAQLGMTGKVIVQASAAQPTGGTASSTAPKTPTKTKAPSTKTVSIASPSAPGGQLAFTGLDAVLPTAALLALGGAFVAFRRRED